MDRVQFLVIQTQRAEAPLAATGGTKRLSRLLLPHVRGKQSWVSFVRNAKQPELPVILLEDLGALVGLIFALFGVSLTLLTHNGVWDAIGTAMIGLLLVAIAVVLALETKSLLLGEPATRDDVTRIRTAIESDGTSIIHLKTLHLGPDELSLPPRSL